MQTVFDFLHDLAADLLLFFGQVRLVFPDEFQLFPDGHLAEFADVLVPDPIGNLCNDKIQALMEQCLDGFHFEKMENAEKNLLK